MEIASRPPPASSSASTERFFRAHATCGGSFEMVVMSHLLLHRAGRHMSS